MAQRKRILITGACGFIGSNLMRYFKEKYHVQGCDDLSFGKADNAEPGLNYNYSDFNDYTHGELDKFDYIVHGATCNIIFAQENPLRTLQVNDVNTAEFFSKVSHSTKVIYLSTASVYGNSAIQPLTEHSPVQLTNVYAMSKLAGEEHLKNLHTNYCILRLSNVYGPFQTPDNPYCGVMGKLLDAVVWGNPFEIYGDGRATRDYTYVGDVCRAVEAAMKNPNNNGETFNIATGVERNIMELLKLTTFIEGAKKFPMKYVEARSIDTVQRRCLDAKKAHQIMGWQPTTDVFHGMQQTVSWLKEQA